MKPDKPKIKKILLLIFLMGSFLILSRNAELGFAQTTTTSQVVATDIESFDLTTDGQSIGVAINMTKAANAQRKTVTSNMTTSITPKNAGAITTMGKCGDDICDNALGEDKDSCPQDCLSCGDDFCATGETCSSCIQDCGACPCGDGVCDLQIGETCTTCQPDCRPCCGNGTCQADIFETYSTCPQDCPACGDGICGTPKTAESCKTCPQDCGACPAAPFCGDRACNGSETCSNCSSDCGVCPPSPCTTCSKGKTCATCEACCGGPEL